MDIPKMKRARSRISKSDIKKFGSFEDRENSFADEADILEFTRMCFRLPDLRKYVKQYLPIIEVLDGGHTFVEKPDGEKGIDLGVQNNHGELVMLIELERWNSWDSEWPSHYRYLHFLGRKDHFLKRGMPFLMAWMNKSRTKVMMCDKETLEKYPSKDKWFNHLQRTDVVKEMPRSAGTVFGETITDTERRLFRDPVT